MGRAPIEAEVSGVSRRMVLLLALAALINYFDRGNLATAGAFIQDELALSNAQLGLLLSVFFWTYAAAQPLAGWLAEKHDPRLILAGGLAIWGGATLLIGFAGSFVILLALRLMLGLGESVLYPSAFKLLALTTRDDERGRANGLLAAGQSFGPALGTLCGGLLIAWLGWRAAFIVAGIASLLWLWPWLDTPRQAALPAAGRAYVEPPARELLQSRELWGSCLGHFCITYALNLVLSWLPVYLVKARGFSVTEMTQIGTIIYVVYGVTSVTTGWASDRWSSAGATATRVRKTALIAGQFGLAVCLLTVAVAGPIGSLVALAGCGLCFGITTQAMFATAQTLAGPGAAARWMGVQNLVGNLSGISAPVITGIVVDRTGSFSAGFAIAGALPLIGILAYGVIVRRIEMVNWQVPLAEAVPLALSD